MKKSAKKSVKSSTPRVKKPAREKQVPIYTFLGKSVEDLSPQAAGIVEAIKTAGGKLTRPELLKVLQKALTTNQSASRVLSYYKKPLISGKWLKVEKISTEPASVEVAAPAAVTPVVVAVVAPEVTVVPSMPPVAV